MLMVALFGALIGFGFGMVVGAWIVADAVWPIKPPSLYDRVKAMSHGDDD